MILGTALETFPPDTVVFRSTQFSEQQNDRSENSFKMCSFHLINFFLSPALGCHPGDRHSSQRAAVVSITAIVYTHRHTYVCKHSNAHAHTICFARL